MSNIIRTSVALIGAFVFLVALLFNALFFGAYVSGQNAGGDSVAVVEGVVVAMVVIEALLILAEKIAWHIGRILSVFLSLAAPVVALVVEVALYVFVLSGFPVYGGFVPFAVLVILSAATVSQIHCFTRDTMLDSQGLFAASGVSLVTAMILSYIASAVLSDPLGGIVLVTLTLCVSGTVLLFDFRRNRGLVQEEGSNVDLQEDDKERQGIREIIVLALPLVFASVFCAFSLGQSWHERSLSDFTSQYTLLALILVASLCFVVVVYQYWIRIADINGFLVGLALPLVLPTVVPLIDQMVPSSIIVAMLTFSQILYVLYAWTSILLIGRIVSQNYSAASIFIVGLLGLYVVFMRVPQIQNYLAASQIISLASIVLLVYLMLYFVQKGSVTCEQSETSEVELGRALQIQCDAAAKRYGLSPRETEILPLLVVGLSASVIGKRIIVSDHTVKTHRYRIYQKMGVSNHEELVEKLDAIGPASHQLPEG